MANAPMSPDEVQRLKDVLKRFCMRELLFDLEKAEVWADKAVEAISEEQNNWDDDFREKGGEG